MSIMLSDPSLRCKAAGIILCTVVQAPSGYGILGSVTGRRLGSRCLGARGPSRVRALGRDIECLQIRLSPMTAHAVLQGASDLAGAVVTLDDTNWDTGVYEYDGSGNIKKIGSLEDFDVPGGVAVGYRLSVIGQTGLADSRQLIADSL